jgi:hypothetical protein
VKVLQKHWLMVLDLKQMNVLTEEYMIIMELVYINIGD